MKLKNSIVKRGGVSAAYWYGSTQDVTGSVAPEGVKFGFVLPSKGGGDTQVLLTIGPEDLRTILKKLAAENLDLAFTFGECAKLAIVALAKAKK